MEPWKELLIYWQSKHVDGCPPARRDIDPIIDLPKLAANLLIADITPAGYRYRLAGSALVERYQEDMTGKLAGSSKFLGQVGQQVIEHYDAVRSEQKPRIVVSGTTKTERASAVVIILPLVARSGETEMLLIGVFYDRHIASTDQIAYLAVKHPDS